MKGIGGISYAFKLVPKNIAQRRGGRGEGAPVLKNERESTRENEREKNKTGL